MFIVIGEDVMVTIDFNVSLVRTILVCRRPPTTVDRTVTVVNVGDVLIFCVVVKYVVPGMATACCQTTAQSVDDTSWSHASAPLLPHPPRTQLEFSLVKQFPIFLMLHIR
jgi:hypothetical protein